MQLYETRAEVYYGNRGPSRQRDALNRGFLTLFVAEFFLSLGDQFLNLLAALMADLLIKVRTVLFLDDFAAFLADGLIELDAVTVARCLSALSTDVFIERRAITVADGIAAFFACLSDGHLSLGGAVVLFSHRFFLDIRGNG